MEILKLFVYILTGAWFTYYVLGLGYCAYVFRKFDLLWQGILISTILGAASLAFYFGG